MNNKECRIEISQENNAYQILIPEYDITLQVSLYLQIQFQIIQNTLIAVIINNHLILARHVDLMRLKKILGGLIFYSSISKFYELTSILNEGNGSQIVKVLCHLTQQYYAAKCILKNNNDNSNILEEIRIMKILQHQNIVKVEEVYESHHTIYIIMELLYKKLTNDFDHNDIKSILYQLFQAIKYLHSKQIVHQNIKLENIMLDQNNVLKLIDFGSSQDLSTHYNAESQNSLKFSEPHYQIDIFNAGIVMYELQDYVYNKSYAGQYSKQVKDKIKDYLMINSCKKNLPTIPDKGTELLESLLDMESTNKMTVNDILNHYYFQEIRNNYIEIHQTIIPTINPKFKQDLINNNYQSTTYIALTDRNQKITQYEGNIVVPQNNNTQQ